MLGLHIHPIAQDIAPRPLHAAEGDVPLLALVPAVVVVLLLAVVVGGIVRVRLVVAAGGVLVVGIAGVDHVAAGCLLLEATTRGDGSLGPRHSVFFLGGFWVLGNRKSAKGKEGEEGGGKYGCLGARCLGVWSGGYLRACGLLSGDSQREFYSGFYSRSGSPFPFHSFLYSIPSPAIPFTIL